MASNADERQRGQRLMDLSPSGLCSHRPCACMQIVYTNRNAEILKLSGTCILARGSERKYRMIISCSRRLRVKHESGSEEASSRACSSGVERIRVQESIEPLIPSPTALRYSCAVLIRVLIGYGGDCRGIRDCTTSKALPFSV
jgi:hypothetical protein